MDADLVYRTTQDYLGAVGGLKSSHRLHGVVEARLDSLLSRLYPDAAGVREVAGVLGGRNDLMQFFFDGRRVVIELMFTPSQVPQDLRLLEQCSADVKIAVLLDREVDPRLADAYFHKRPESFPFLWLEWVMVRGWEGYCLARLKELIDEEPAIGHLRSILSTPTGLNLAEPLRAQLAEMERKLRPYLQTAERLEDLSAKEVIRRIILMEIGKLGVPKHRMLSLYVWLDRGIEHAARLVLHGFQAFLITDLRGRHAIWSDGDLADDLIPGADDDSSASVVLCLNHIINSVWRAQGLETSSVTWHFVHSYYLDDQASEASSDPGEDG